MLPQIPPSFALRRKPFDRLCPKSLNYEDKRPAAQIEAAGLFAETICPDSDPRAGSRDDLTAFAARVILQEPQGQIRR